MGGFVRHEGYIIAIDGNNARIRRSNDKEDESMAQVINMAITAEQFKKICEAALPHLLALDKIAREGGADAVTMIYITPNGYINMSGGFNGWSLTRLDAKGEFFGSYDYHERFDVTHDGAPEADESIG